MARQGRLVAIVSQLILIALSVVSVSIAFAGWQLLPNLLLLGVLMAGARMPALAVAVTVASIQLPNVPLEFGLKHAYLFMWELTFVGLTLLIISKSDKRDRWAKRHASRAFSVAGQ